MEALLDLEVVSAIAPSADLLFYTAQDTTFQSGLFLAIQRALDDNTINILNVSFGGCEAYQTVGGNQQILNFWEQAAAQGISVTVSTGDSGAAGCDNPNNETTAAQGLQVNGIGSTPTTSQSAAPISTRARPMRALTGALRTPRSAGRRSAPFRRFPGMIPAAPRAPSAEIRRTAIRALQISPARAAVQAAASTEAWTPAEML